MKILLPPTPQYKVNLHAHSTVSDGRLTPKEIKEYYMANGYHAVAFTDHEVLVPHEELTDENFVALHGYEYGISHGPKGPHRAYYHLNLIAKRPDTRTHVLFRPSAVWGNAVGYIPTVTYRGDYTTGDYSQAFVNRVIREAHKEGYLVQYNHPRWSLHHYPDYAELEGVDFLEVFNYTCTLNEMPERDDRVFDDMLRQGKFPCPTGNDDNHNEAYPDSSRWDSLGAYNMVAADTLTYEGLITALEKGAFYATEGPRILSLTVDDGRVTVRTTPLAFFRAQGSGRNGYTAPISRTATAETFTFRIEPSWDYFRLILEDQNGLRAYSRAYRTEEIF